MKKRLLAMLVCVGMCAGLLPVGAAAAGDAEFTTVDLAYTRDVFIDEGETGKPTDGKWPEEFPLSAGEKFHKNVANNIALGERRMINPAVTGYDEDTGNIVSDGVPFKVGPLSVTGGDKAALNAIHAGDTQGVITVDVPDGIYSSIQFLASATCDDNNTVRRDATAELILQDGTVQDGGIDGIVSFRIDKSRIDQKAYERQLPSTLIAPRSDGANYSANLCVYTVETGLGVVDKLVIRCPQAVVFAVTLVGMTTEQSVAAARDAIDNLPSAISPANAYKVAEARALVTWMTTESGVTEADIGTQYMARLAQAEARVTQITRPTQQVELPYTFDAFITKGETYTGTDYAHPDFPNGLAFYEDGLKKLQGFSANTRELQFGGVTYQFGPLGDAGVPNREPNVARGYVDGQSAAIKPELQPGHYQTIRLLATNVSSSDVSASVNIKYTDGTSYCKFNIKAFRAAINDDTQYLSNQKINESGIETVTEHYVGKIGAERPANEGESGPGVYDGHIYEYVIRVDSSKQLESIEIWCQKMVVFAAVAEQSSPADLAYDYTIEGIDATGALTAGTQVTGVTVSVNQADAATGKLYVGLYDAEGTLQTLARADVPAAAAGTVQQVTLSAPLTVTAEMGAGVTAQAFIWTDALQPLSPAYGS